MKLTFLGTGVAIPQANRVQSGILIDTGRKPLLLDCGSGVLNRINDSGNDHTSIEHVVLTHLHLDHVSDLLCLIKANWLCGKTDISLYGPAGTESYLNKLLDAYSYMKDKVDIQINELIPGKSYIIEDTGCTINSVRGIHSVPSLSYRVDTDSGSVVYTGDTEPSTSIMQLSNGADCLIHECSFPPGFETTNHTNPDMLAEMLDSNPPGCNEIYLTHLYPHMQGHENESLEILRKHFHDRVKIAEDLMEIIIKKKK
ncbi:beta-lactamase-like protein [Methanosalsum zhilinae DSM 4017]|uniref:Beta-lactamase-like protein n=1 Tax=Methanosalsum zhilinae (strain DSM 4017 / NBRC 107636 / OCM 62 / WeN5) TaxID=679901 RepID=F7XLM4_METZD|nr:MBL fold metallo-hydrolase [Methanosalsum zhilinae]AEH60845.1 beta-lactamase-like protein [Methanosalsum zhilinae DSM 4017]